MTSPQSDPLLSHLETQEARLAAQEASIAALRAELATLRKRPAVAQRQAHRPLLISCTVVLLIALAPLGLRAANPFSDLTGGVHDADIDAIYNAGVTTGCVSHQEYCPTANVTRQEMASFLARLGGLGGHPPVANAATAQSAQTATHATSADTATSATSAESANSIAGYTPNALLRVAYGQGTSLVALTTSYKNVAMLTITAPGAGYLLVSSTVTAANTEDCPCTTTTRLELGTLVSPGTGARSEANGGFENIAETWVIPVGPGTYTIAVRAKAVGAPTTKVGATGRLAVLFVPFGATGATP